MAFDSDLQVEMAQMCLCQEMDCLEGPNDRVQVAITKDSVVLSCLQKSDTDIILSKTYYYQEDRKKKNIVGRIFLVLFIMAVCALLIFYAYKQYRRRKKTDVEVVVSRPEQNNNEEYQQQLSSVSMISNNLPAPEQEQFNPEKQHAFNQYDQGAPPLTLGLPEQPGAVISSEQLDSSASV